MTAWNGWYHCNGNTFGTWLRGEARGWRARHHREHCEGDYKRRPPPGYYAVLEGQSRRLMDRAEVRLSPEARRVACVAMVESLLQDGVDVIAVCVDDHQFPALARFSRRASEEAQAMKAWASPLARDDPARFFVGRAKGRAARALSSAGLVPPGGVWAKRFRCLPVRDRSHQVAVARYIIAHGSGSRGACVWSVAAGTPPPRHA